MRVYGSGFKGFNCTCIFVQPLVAKRIASIRGGAEGVQRLPPTDLAAPSSPFSGTAAGGSTYSMLPPALLPSSMDPGGSLAPAKSREGGEKLLYSRVTVEGTCKAIVSCSQACPCSPPCLPYCELLSGVPLLPPLPPLL